MNNKFLQFLGLVKRSGNLLEGYNRCEEVMYKKKIFLFIFSTEVSLKTKDKFVRYCEENNIPYVDCFTKTELGNVLGRAEINVLGVVDDNMAKKLMAHYNNVK